jgi:hypothetical protein
VTIKLRVLHRPNMRGLDPKWYASYNNVDRVYRVASSLLDTGKTLVSIRSVTFQEWCPDPMADEMEAL